MTDEIEERLRQALADVAQCCGALLAELETYKRAVFLTAAERAYDELAVRRAVSPELSDLIIREHKKT